MILLFIAASQTFNLPPGLLDAICYVESGHKADAMHVDDGGSHSIGICQIKLSTARQMGFKGTEEALRNPRTNIYYAASYLHNRLVRYDGDVVNSVAAYNAGSVKLTDKKVPINVNYVRKVLRIWSIRR